MPRPFINSSIDELEAAFEQAQRKGDKSDFETLLHELSFRHTSRAKELRGMLVDTIESPNAGNRAAANQRPQRVRGRDGGEKSQLVGQARMPKYAPTDEQAEAIRLFLNGKSLKINAYAGTGKTSTLELLAHSSRKHGQYIAFNRDIVLEAKKTFPTTVDCATTHSMALRATTSEYKATPEKMFGKISVTALVEILQLSRWQIDEQHILQPRSIAFITLETLKRFMQSEDLEPQVRHVPRHGSLVTASKEVLVAVADYAVQTAKHLWTRMLVPGDPIPLGHDGYLKLWALSNPVIATDFILLDEAQDTNPVVLGVLRKQQAQMIYVGDRYQQIYEWRGAVNAMEEISTNSSIYLTLSFRFGEAIARSASRILAMLGEARPIIGNPEVNSTIGTVTPDAILARTNATTISAVIETLDAGKHPHLVGGNRELLDMLQGVTDLKSGQQSTVPDFFGFSKWQEVVEFAKSSEGQYLLSFVNLVESRGERQLMWALNHVVNADGCDVVISTAHKAKGRQWRRVRLMDDFLKSRANENLPSWMRGSSNGFDPAELRLFYVAFTRAQEGLEVPPQLLQLIGAA